jgi:hypothetical protein
MLCNALHVNVNERHALVVRQGVSVATSGSWYDVTVQLQASPSCPLIGSFTRRYMGRMETGRETTSDPAMADGDPEAHGGSHPPISEHYRVPEKWNPTKNCASRRSRLKDECWSEADVEAMMNRFTHDEL